MDWRKASEKSSNYKYSEYTIPNRWLLIHYYEALNILFRVENSLRVFVYTVLKSTFLDKWSDLNIITEDNTNTTISAIAKKRIHQAKDFGYLGYEISSPLMHLNSGELIRLITSEEYWKYFAIYFKGRKEIIRNKLDEIGSVRNSLAHFRPIKEDDIEVIKQNAKHALVAVESCLSEITNTITIIPTNSEDSWYKKFISLGAPNCVISLYQSTSTEWVRVQIQYSCTIIRINRYGDDWLSYQIRNLRTPNIIELFTPLAKYAIYVTENIPYTTMPENLKPEFIKNVSFVFSKTLLSENIDGIIESFSNLLNTITKEEDLIANDNLAQGDLVETKIVSANFIAKENNSRWDIGTETMKFPFDGNHPPEYWGDIGQHQLDFIASSTKYPWMPSNVSSFDI